MSFDQCRGCRLALEAPLFAPDGTLEREGYRCEIDESFVTVFSTVPCPYHVAWNELLPPPARSCQKSLEGHGCGVGSGASCSSCGAGCSAGGCGGATTGTVDALAQYGDPDDGYEYLCEQCASGRDGFLQVLGAIGPRS